MITDVIKWFGYSELEAKVYVALQEHGSMTGYEISKRSGIARSKVYNVIEQVVQKGSILASCTVPISYSALPSEELLEQLKQKTSKKLDQLETYFATLPTHDSDNLLWKMSSKTQVTEKLVYSLSTAQKSLYIQLWSNDLTTEIIDLLTQAEERLNQFVCIIFSDENTVNLPFKRYYLHPFLEDKLQDMGGRWLNVICDNNYILFGAVGNGCDVIWTQNKAMLSLGKEYIKHDAYTLKIINEHTDILKETYGNDFKGIRAIY